MRKNKRPGNNYIKPRTGKKWFFAAGAAALAVTVTGTSLWHILGSSIAVEARESFSGIGKVVENHGEADPFVILDIVPGTASYNTGDYSLELSLGTIGYLAGGQSPIEKSLADAFKNDIRGNFVGYDARAEFAEAVIPQGMDVSFPWISYEEGYAGITSGLNTAGGWTQIFDSYLPGEGETITADDVDKLHHWGSVFGKATKKSDTTTDTTGYDYNYIGKKQALLSLRSDDDSETPDVICEAADDGEYYAVFAYQGEAKAGYRAVLVSEDLESYSDATSVYTLVDGVYHYVGQKKDIFGSDSTDDTNTSGTVSKPGKPDQETPDDEDGESDESDSKDDNTDDSENTGSSGNGGSTGDGDSTGEDGSTGSGDTTGDGGSTGGGDSTGDGSSTSGGDSTDDGGSVSGGDTTGNDGAGNSNTSGAENTDTNNIDGGTGTASLGWLKFIGGVSDPAFNPDITNNPDNTTNPDTTTTPDTTTNPSTTTNPDTTTDTGASDGQGSGGSAGTGVTGGNGDYYILTFVYVEDLEEPENLYELDWYVPKEEKTIGAITPFDAYNISSYDDLMQEDEEIAAFALRSADDGEPFVYVGAGKGEYRLEECVEKNSGNSADSTNPDAGADIDTDAGFLMTIYNAPVFFRCCKANDWLERYVFHSLEDDDNASETFDVQVKVVTADKVELTDVADADLIYLEAGLGEFLGNDTTRSYITKDSDMSQNVLFNIVTRAVNDLLPVIVDYDVAADTGNYKDTNYQKLAQILLKKDLTAFYQDMGNVDNMFLNIKSESSDYPNKTDNHYNYVNRNIYVVNADLPLVAEDFYEPFDKDDTASGFMEVIAAIKAENSTLEDNDKIPEYVSKAKAIQYIINYSVGLISEFRDFSILELQPTDNAQSDLRQDYDVDKDSTVLYWKKADSSSSGQQILRSSKLINITVATESVAQFAGELQDINNTYQMIFIGLDGQRLNYNKDEKKTVYNDENLNGRVYTGVGDIASASEERYENIDITPQKREALIDFLKAGYPIVVEDDFFVDKTAKDVDSGAINTKYIDDSSQMYYFLSTAVSEYSECIYTISDVHSSAVFAAQINVRRPQIDYLDAKGDPVDEALIPKKQTIIADEEGNYQGTISYRVLDDTGEAYSGDVSLRLYLDINQDGRFAPEEEADSFSADNGQLIVSFDTPEKGIIPWKLEVSDAGNNYRRDELTGFFQIAYSTPTPVRILQVVAETGDAAYDLKQAYKDTNRLGHYLEGAEGLTGTRFEIETLTVGDLQTALGENARYLTGYDVLVLGFGPAYHLGGAAEAVNQYMQEGRAVLVSSAAASGDVDRMGLDTSLMGQQNGRTYSKLGSEKDGVTYYQYKDMHADMFNEQSNLPAAKINDGVISHYPYEIGGDFTIARSIRGADYLLDMTLNGAEGNTIADVTAWYCLSDPSGSALDNPTVYDISRMDAANNYYIYSRGNVVYVGQDSYPYDYNNYDEETLEHFEGTVECQLFVNALMTAYNVGVKNPQVTIVAGLAEDSSEIESICIPFDEQIREDGDENAGLLDETTDLYFKLIEPNMAFNKTVEIAFYYQNDAGEEVDIGGKIVRATKFDSAIWTVEQNQLIEVDAPDLTPGKIYKIKAPVIPLENAGSTNADIYVVVRTVFNKLGQERTAIGSDSVSLNRAQLFLLE